MKIRIFFTVLIVILLSGCATKRETLTDIRIVERRDTLREVVERVDSVFIRDSVSVVQRGDTIVKERWRVEYRDRWRDRDKEVIVERTDTIVKTQRVEVEKRLTGWQRFKQRVGGVAVVLLIGAVGGLMLWDIRRRL